MGLIKFSGLVTGVWGKLNGSVFTRNKSGAIIKNKTTPRNPQTAGQTDNRSSMSYLSRKWRLLDEDQRRDWNALALTITNYNYFGDSYSPSGFNIFCRLNQNLFLIGQPYIYDCPAEPALTPLHDVGGRDYILPLTELMIYFPLQTTEAGVTHLIYATPAESQGIYYSKHKYKLIGVIPENTVNEYDSLTDYLSQFPTPPANTKVFFKLRAVDNATGFDVWDGTWSDRFLTILVLLGIGLAQIGITNQIG
jgi:hypothetical protein